MRRQAFHALNTLALVWVGMLIGVSFLATPAKFLAPSLTLPVALDIGRYTFGLFSIVELVGAIALFAVAMIIRRGWLILLFASLVGSLVILEFVWLLPALDARVEIILQGGMPKKSGLHNLYIVCDAAKLLLLGAIAWRSHSASVAPQGEISADVH